MQDISRSGGRFLATLLRIDASARTEGSISRALADYFQERWIELHPDDEIIVRDLAQDVVPQIEAMTIAGFYTSDSERTPEMRAAIARSDQLIAELRSADVLVLSTPMYNFSAPAALKAYIDQIARINETFGYDPARGLYGMVEGKKAFVLIAKGLVYTEGPLDTYDFLEPYLKKFLPFLGITDVEFVSVEASTLPDLERNREMALRRIDHMLQGVAVSR
jgi:FMN-dependent NADH-azoreductase